MRTVSRLSRARSETAEIDVKCGCVRRECVVIGRHFWAMGAGPWGPRSDTRANGKCGMDALQRPQQHRQHEGVGFRVNLHR